MLWAFLGPEEWTDCRLSSFPEKAIDAQNKNVMRCDEKVSLNLNEEVLDFIRKRLKTFGEEHPECKYEILYWIDDLVTKSVKEIYDYLAENECPSILKTGGDIIGKSRAQFHRYIKKEAT